MDDAHPYTKSVAQSGETPEHGGEDSDLVAFQYPDEDNTEDDTQFVLGERDSETAWITMSSEHVADLAEVQ